MKRLLFLPLLLLGVSLSLAGPRPHPSKSKNSIQFPPVNGTGGSIFVNTGSSGSLTLAGSSSYSSITCVTGGSLVTGATLGTAATGVLVQISHPVSSVSSGGSLSAISAGSIALMGTHPIINLLTLTISTNKLDLNGDLNENNPASFVHVSIVNPNPGGTLTPILILGNSLFTARGILTASVPFTVNGAAYPAGTYPLPLYQSITPLTGSEIPIMN